MTIIISLLCLIRQSPRPRFKTEVVNDRPGSGPSVIEGRSQRNRYFGPSFHRESGVSLLHFYQTFNIVLLISVFTYKKEVEGGGFRKFGISFSFSVHYFSTPTTEDQDVLSLVFVIRWSGSTSSRSWIPDDHPPVLPQVGGMCSSVVDSPHSPGLLEEKGYVNLQTGSH